MVKTAPPRLWKKSRPNAPPAAVKKPRVKKPDHYFQAHLNSALFYTSSFKLPRRWLRSLPPVTYLYTLLGTRSLAALMQLE
ncbi:hypothetical protein DQC25_06355 [Salmonella enterica subsp. enterica serovar Weltevreden]|nr:hypothetical protein [Salmonella enterica subsp. enterica serovar Weltevreden]